MTGGETATSFSSGRSRSSTRRLIRRLITPAAVLLCAASLAWVQFSFQGMFDDDSYFHTRAARELDQKGIQRTFPQTVYSTWRDRYSDKDWLFHAWLIPFQRISSRLSSTPAAGPGSEDLATPGKWAMTVLYLLYFSGMAFALGTLGARLSGIWLALFLLSSPFVVWRLLAVRPGVAGVLLLLLEIALIMRASGPLLAVVGALHVYTHSSFVLLPAMAVAAVAASAVRREPPHARVLAWACVGPAVGLVLHPYFPNNLSIAWAQLAGVAEQLWLGREGIPPNLFGEELRGVLTSEFVGWAPAYLPAALALLAFLASRRRVSTPGLALLMMTAALLVAGLLSYRFMDFFLPVSVLLGARLWTELLDGASLRELAKREGRLFWAAVVPLSLCAIAVLARPNILAIHREMSGVATTGEQQRAAVNFLDTVASPGEIVYHNFWPDFSTLYHFRPAGRYIEALDPIFLFRFDRDLFAKGLAVLSGAAVDAHAVIKGDFHARWVYLSRANDYPAMLEALARDPRFVEVFRDQSAIVFRVD